MNEMGRRWQAPNRRGGKGQSKSSALSHRLFDPQPSAISSPSPDFVGRTRPCLATESAQGRPSLECFAGPLLWYRVTWSTRDHVVKRCRTYTSIRPGRRRIF
jgi:hypothetical protein